ncbi:DUF7718 family protein [Haloarcula halophila]|uniref:DUF7718 family protein n=1 Tax=Halomicroarcula sp. GCM10025335 TaxID=3252668 RepID=UPI003614E841
MSEFEYVIEAGMFRDRSYQIGTRADPNLDAAADPSQEASWAVILFYEQEDGERIEVARVDNTEHDEGVIHIDRLYREEQADRKDFDIDVTSVYEAEKYISEDWQHYARQHWENYE